MNLTLACNHIISQLTQLVQDIREKDFLAPSEALGKSTIGQHLRHTLEFFICMEAGYKTGIINYDKRAHDKLIETDKVIALSTLSKISEFVGGIHGDHKLKLEVSYDLDKDEFVTIETNAVRELVYNIEHAVHHMAIMKIGIREVAPYIKLPADFGIAASTIRYKETPIHTESR
jgi:hypothetical protein